MYNVNFEESFFIWLDKFLISMKSYYKYFYSNTWIYDEDKIVKWYFELFEQLKTEIIDRIYEISKSWMIWRKIIYNNWSVENCSITFFIRSYRINFTVIKDDNLKEIIVYDLKIEVK